MTVNLAKPNKGLEDLNRAGDDGWEAVAISRRRVAAGVSCTRSFFSSDFFPGSQTRTGEPMWLKRFPCGEHLIRRSGPTSVR
jgi:hypothetical protein